MRSKGKLVSWNDDKGYGFIVPIGGGPQVFIHIKAFGNRNRRPSINDIVSYAVARDRQGRVRADSATLTGDQLKSSTKRNGSFAVVVVALLFLIILNLSTYATNLPPSIPIAYLIISVITFFAYAIDKSAARSGNWRTSERTLHFLALAGGWPGALVAQQTLRHKSKKASFRLVFRVTVLANCVALMWLHTTDGRASLEQLLSTI